MASARPRVAATAASSVQRGVTSVGVNSITIVGLPGLLAGLDTFAPQLAAANKVAMEASVHLVEADAKARVPRKTGRLAGSIQTEVTGTGMSLVGTVGTDVTYGSAVEDGTRAHDIAPMSASALMVPVAPTGGFGGGRLSGHARAGQQVAFFAHVRHPGSIAKPFLGPALEDNRAPIQAIFTAAADRVLKQIAAQARATLSVFGKL